MTGAMELRDNSLSKNKGKKISEEKREGKAWPLTGQPSKGGEKNPPGR